MKNFFVQIRDWISGVWYFAARARHVADTVMNIEMRLSRPSTTVPVVETELPAEAIDALMQLRSETKNINGRTGRAVTVFIPAEALERLRSDAAKQKLFIDKVATQLVRRSLYGVWHSQAGTVIFPTVTPSPTTKQ